LQVYSYHCDENTEDEMHKLLGSYVVDCHPLQAHTKKGLDVIRDIANTLLDIVAFSTDFDCLQDNSSVLEEFVSKY